MKYISLLALILIMLLPEPAFADAKLEGNYNSPGQLKRLDNTDSGDKSVSKPVPDQESSSEAEIVDENHKRFIWSGSEHYLTTNKFIRNKEVLQINAGCHVLAAGNYAIIVEDGGIIEAIGNRLDPIVFSADWDYDKNYGERLNGMSLEFWQGIRFLDTGGSPVRSTFDYCHFSDNQINTAGNRSANQLIRLDGNNEVIFRNSWFYANSFDAQEMLSASSSRLVFIDCQFSHNSGSLNFSDCSLEFYSSRLADNQVLQINLNAGDFIMQQSDLSCNQDIAVNSSNCRTYNISHCSMSANASSQAALLNGQNQYEFKINNSVFQSNSSPVLNCQNTDTLLQRCLFADQNHSEVMLFSSSAGKRLIKLINCQVSNIHHSPVASLGSNLIFIIINSIFADNAQPQFILQDNSSESSFFAYSSVIDKNNSIRNDVYRMKTQWKNIIEPYSKGNLLIDRGISELNSGDVTIFRYDNSQFKGKAPDIGYWEE